MFSETNFETSPLGEEGVQVRSGEDYMSAMRKEAVAYREQLLRMFPIPTDLKMDVVYKIVGRSHDFGTYLEIVIRFNENNPDAKKYVRMVENNEPEEWDDEARAILFGEQKNVTEKVFTQDEAFKIANKMVNEDWLEHGFSFTWDELPDYTSLWDYLSDGMTEDQIKSQAKIAMQDRLEEAGMTEEHFEL
ncbi:MAG: hypothetical protein ACW99A_13310 [Candidatus Kariarchaeaceae archaeon]|jgi:hypothetical protein